MQTRRENLESGIKQSAAPVGCVSAGISGPGISIRRHQISSHAVTDGMMLQYYETAANLGDTGESNLGLMVPNGQDS